MAAVSKSAILNDVDTRGLLNGHLMKSSIIQEMALSYTIAFNNLDHWLRNQFTCELDRTRVDSVLVLPPPYETKEKPHGFSLASSLAGVSRLFQDPLARLPRADLQ